MAFAANLDTPHLRQALVNHSHRGSPREKKTAAPLAEGRQNRARGELEEPSPEPEPRGQPLAKEEQRETLTVFDWDDTLLCTTFLGLHGKDDEPVGPAMEPHMRGIADMARQLIECAAVKGRVAIVTNAVEGWVQHSAEKWLPHLVPALARVTVVSARARYEERYPEHPQEWKRLAFLDLGAGLGAQAGVNLISVGDSDTEMDAAKGLAERFVQAQTKTIKLQQHPSPEELSKELRALAAKFDTILDAPCDLTISLQRKWAGPV